MAQMNRNRRKSQSLNNKIHYDLHADIDGHSEKRKNEVRRAYSINYFKEGKDLGFDSLKQENVSREKYQELAGHNAVKYDSNSASQANSRHSDKWRKSSLQLG